MAHIMLCPSLHHRGTALHAPGSGGASRTAQQRPSSPRVPPRRPLPPSLTASPRHDPPHHHHQTHTLHPGTTTKPPPNPAKPSQEKDHLLTRVGLPNLEVLGDLGEGGTSLVELVRARASPAG